MKYLKTFESYEINEGKFFRGSLKTALSIASSIRLLGQIITLKWSKLKTTLETLPQGYKLINILDTIKEDSKSWTMMKDTLSKYKEKYGSDMKDDLNDLKSFGDKLDGKESEKVKEISEKILKMIDDALYSDEEFKQTIQELGNKITQLGQGHIEYPEEWFDQPISQMDEVDLKREMDKALDDKNYQKARYINKYLNR